MNFYNNLSDDGVVFFWIVVFLLMVLIFIAVILYFKNKKLMSLLEKKDEDNNGSEEVFELEDSDLKIKDKIEEDVKEETVEDVKETKIVRQEPTEIKQEMDISTPRAYQHNVLRELSKRMPTSPIHVDRAFSSDDISVYTTEIIEDDLDNDFTVIEDNVSPLENMEDRYETNDNMKFASEIVSKMEEEIKPSNIELTDYEKKQEEEAIISYDELQKVKDKIYNITDDEETDEFIDELKNFRNDLK